MEIKEEIDIKYPIHIGPLFSCCNCASMFISFEFLLKHIDKCKDFPITMLFKQKLNSLGKRPGTSKGNNKTKEKEENKDKFFCKKCSITLPNKRVHISHIRKHYLNTCNECNEIFKTRKALVQHKAVKHNIKKDINCVACSRVFIDRRQYRSHFNAMHSNNMYSECEKCKKKFDSKMLLSEHMKKFHQIDTYKCLKCRGTFRYSWDFHKHIQEKHPITK